MRNVNGLPVYEGTDPCALDDYSLALANVVKTLILDILSQNTEDIEDISYDISDLKSALRILEQEFELHDESISELINESGATIDLSFNNTNNKLTLALKNKAGTAISTKTATLPLSNMITDASYNNTTKKLTFTKKDGSTKEVSIADLIDGLVSQDDFEQSQAEQDTEIEELQTKVTNLEETVNSELEDGTAEGTEITVNDSATADGSLLPNGNTDQNQYEGYNLFESNSYPVSRTLNGVTITNNGDGSFTLNGTCTTHNTNIQLGATSKIQNILAESSIRHTAYYVSGTCTKGEGNGANYCVLRLNYNLQNSMIHLEQLKDAGILFKTNSQNTTATGWSWDITLDEGDTFNNFTIKYMLVKGTEELPYEPYVGEQASPSEEYPQTVHTLKGNNRINIISQNYFDKSNPNIKNNLIFNNTEFTYSSTGKIIYVTINGGMTYTIFKKLSSRFRVCTTANIPKSDEQILNYKAGNTETKLTIQTSKQANYLCVYYYLSGTDVMPEQEIMDSIYICENEKYQTKTLTLPNGLEMCNIENYRDKFVKQGDNWIVPNKIQKIDSYNGETITTPYISTTGGLDTGSTVYYVGNTDLTITDTTLIAELDELLEIRTYYGQTNITVEAEDLAPMMTLNYKKTNRNLNSEIELIKARLDLLEN